MRVVRAGAKVLGKAVAGPVAVEVVVAAAGVWNLDARISVSQASESK
jgi:hypothetical protein